MRKFNILLITMLLLSSMIVSASVGLETLPVHWTGYNAAVLSGNVTDLNGSTNTTVFFYYKEISESVWSKSYQNETLNTTGNSLLNIFDLTRVTNYTYFIASFNGTEYVNATNTENFTTKDAPLAVTLNATLITDTTARLQGNLTSLGGYNTTRLFFIYYSFEDPFTSITTPLVSVNETGLFTTDITGLSSYSSYAFSIAANWTDELNVTFQESFDSESFITESTPEENTVTTGILNVKTLLFAAFGLLAIMILASVAFFIIKIFSDGFDASGLTMIAVVTIGSAVVLLVAYIIVASVANSLI